MDKKQLQQILSQATQGTGLFPEMMMAQILVESGSLNSELSVKHNNFSGQKAFDLTGKTKDVDYAVMDTTEIFNTKKEAKDFSKKQSAKGLKTISTTKNSNGQFVLKVEQAFKKFTTPEEGVKSHIDFLINNPRYAKAGVLDAATPEDQAKALKSAGYATDPYYADKLVSVLDNTVRKQFPEYLQNQSKTASPQTKSSSFTVNSEDKAMEDLLAKRKEQKEKSYRLTADYILSPEEEKEVQDAAFETASDIQVRINKGELEGSDNEIKNIYYKELSEKLKLTNIDVKDADAVVKAKGFIKYATSPPFSMCAG